MILNILVTLDTTMIDDTGPLRDPNHWFHMFVHQSISTSKNGSKKDYPVLDSYPHGNGLNLVSKWRLQNENSAYPAW